MKPMPNIAEQIDTALKQDDIPKIYANNFICAMGSGDVAVLFKNGSRSTGMLNLSFNAAKTLALRLRWMIEQLEKDTGQTIMSTEDIDQTIRTKSANLTRH